MRYFNKLLSSISLIVILAACGGGGSSDSATVAPTPESIPTPTPSFIIKNATDFQVSELQAATEQLVEERYKGLKTNASINGELSQRVFQYLFNDERTDIPSVGHEDFQDLVDINGEVNKRVECDYQGNVGYTGELDANLLGNLSLTYDNCEQDENYFPISGNVAISAKEKASTDSSTTYYFDNLRWDLYGQEVGLTGYYEIDLQSYDVHIKQHILVTIDNEEQLLLTSEFSFNNDVSLSTPVNVVGDIYIGTEGKVDINLQEAYGSFPYLYEGTLTIEGDKLSEFTFFDTFVAYTEDTDNDGVTDVGAYFNDIYELLYSSFDIQDLVGLDVLSFAPYAGSPSIDSYQDLYTTTPLEVFPGYFSDRDTADEDLLISYRWYINDELIADQVSNILPAYIAVSGDIVTVTMMVTDGVNSTESQSVRLTILNSPLTIEVTDLPEFVQASDSVQFQVVISDADLEATDSLNTFFSGPEGAIMDEEGMIVWNVPDDLMFPFQNYTFTFGITDDDGVVSEKESVSVKVESSKAFPIVISGMEVPKSNKSMFVADFDGDNKNEILSTDGHSSVFLIESHEDTYRKKWTYPFKLPGEGSIIQVLSANIDADATKEIVVVSENGVSVIDGLDNLATLLFTTDESIKFATVQDIDGDGIDELAYIYSNSSSNSIVNVVSFIDADKSLFSTNLEDAQQIEFANVDEDISFELVSNNGLVYDVGTWQNQWFSGTKFGNASVTTGDYNGDGIEEVAGSDTWGNIGIYSVVNKSQIDSLDNFNTCTLHSADVNNDGADELLVGDCQWGSITAYKLIDNTLTSLWSVDAQAHGSVSLTSGDSDNDGKLELHWGSGISSSGEDVFVSADIDEGSISIKETTSSPQLDSYSSAGWSTLFNAEERAVFFIPSTGSGYDGSRIAMLDSNGDIELSDELSSNWDNSPFAVTTDFNNDGFGDVFLPLTDTYNGALGAMQLNDGTIHWQNSGDYDSNIGVIKAEDINNDGFDDAIYSDSRSLKAIDIYNELIILNYTFDYNVTDFVTSNISGVSSVIVSTGVRLHFLTVNGAVVSEQSFIDQSCSKIELINNDTDSDLELICLQENYNDIQELVIFGLGDFTFTEFSRTELDDKIIDIVVDPSRTQQQNLFVTTYTGSYYSYWDDDSLYQIKKMSSNGHVIWESPNLVGRPTEHGLKVRNVAEMGLEMLLSTNRMMYWIK